MIKNKKSKVVLFSVLGLAAISIGTVGFATWMVGVENKSETLTFTANVDNTLNESIYLEAVASKNNILVCESSAHPKTGNDIVGTKDGVEGSLNVNANALQFTFDTLKYSLGKGAVNPTKLHISLASTEINTMNKVTDNKLGEERSGGTWEYLKFDKVYTIGTDINVSSDDKGSYVVYDFGNKTFTLGWGSFFGAKGDSPVTFYNTISAKEAYSTADAKIILADNVNAELAAMNSALKGQKLTINVALEA